MVQWLGAEGGTADASRVCSQHACADFSFLLQFKDKLEIGVLSVPRCHSPCDIWDGIQPPIGSDCLQLLRWLWKSVTTRSYLNLIICCIEDAHVVNWKMWHLLKLGWKKWKMLRGWIQSCHSLVLEIDVIYTNVISIRACPIFNLLRQYVILYLHLHVCACSGLCACGGSFW